jgi:hypothetical protein
MKKKANKKTKVSTEEKAPPIANVLLGVGLSSGHKLEFMIQQTVYLKNDKEQKPRLVTGISLRPFNSVTYGLTENTTETWHYGFEINDERDIVMATSN